MISRESARSVETSLGPRPCASSPPWTISCIARAADGRTESAYRAAYVEGLQNVLAALPRDALQRALFTSSTAVYGQSDGETVDEASPTEPASFSGRILLEAESLLRAQMGGRGVTLRLAGIYGPTRTRLARSVLVDGVGPGVDDASGARLTNRIHRDDCAGALAHLLRVREPSPVYVGVDDAPAPIAAVRAFIADELRRAGLEVPDHRDGSTGRGRGANKRCSNAKLRQSGYSFRFPSFREGYPAICAELSGQA